MGPGSQIEFREMTADMGVHPEEADAAYLSDQLITYIGNKRSLLKLIGLAIEKVQHRLNRKELQIIDLFSGSGVVARYLDTARKLLNEIPDHVQHFFLAPLLSEASIHANTAGVFKGFYKDRDTGIGKFGGRKGDALFRITGDICLPFPLFGNFECPVSTSRQPANELVPTLDEVDFAYLDPPYNQHL